MPEPLETSDQEMGAASHLETLVRTHRDHLARIARAEGLGPEDALDAVQDAFEIYLERTTEASPPSVDDARRVLATITRNAARNARRLHAHARPHVSEPALLEALPGPTDDTETLLARSQEHARLRGCVATLARIRRAVVTLRLLEGVPGDEVARTLGLSPANVAVLLHRAKHELAACMAARV